MNQSAFSRVEPPLPSVGTGHEEVVKTLLARADHFREMWWQSERESDVRHTEAVAPRDQMIQDLHNAIKLCHREIASLKSKVWELEHKK